jgi:hypothetical protein
MAGTLCGEPTRLGRGLYQGSWVYHGSYVAAEHLITPYLETPRRKHGGAGGNWLRKNERPDPRVVKQYNTLACGPASAEMILKDRGISFDQRAIAKQLKQLPVYPFELAHELLSLDPQGQWVANTVDPSSFNALNNRAPWAALFYEQGAKTGHIVVVDGVDALGDVRIRDPWDGTMYEMTISDFMDAWTWEAIYRGG